MMNQQEHQQQFLRLLQHCRWILIVLCLCCCCTAKHGTAIAFTNAAIAATRGGAAANTATTTGSTPTTTIYNTESHLNSIDELRYATISTQQQAAATSSSSSSSDASLTSKVSGEDPSQNKGPLNVLFLSADTGGGHRASAESLANQFLLHYPGSTYHLLDIWTTDGIKPYNTLVKAYKHLSAHPRQWRFLYHLSNSRPWELGMDLHSTWTCEKRIRQRIASYHPDVVVSVHPAMNYTPLAALKKIAKETGKHTPFFTVVTDLGSGHCTWFHRTIDKMFVASDRLRKLAKRRGRTPDDKIIMTGLPIRNDFSIQSKKLGDRTTPSGKAYQLQMKQLLLQGHDNCDPNAPMILVMGGGEGVGSLSAIVDELYASCTKRGIDATICVVCGRNEKLQEQLRNRDWSSVANRNQKIRFKSRLPILGERKRCIAIQRALNRAKQEPPQYLGKVNVIGLGFVTNMADYMVGSDILVTKAGPGTIAEAAAVGLPIMLTSFLPGQEAGNVDYVLDYGFGDYSEDPVSIAEEVATWLRDSSLLDVMSHRAQAAGRPDAASEIVLNIGSETHVWKALNNKHDEAGIVT